MNITYDLHIHSCLSPCGHEDMTPNNIVNMAYIKGLDAIAVTDHNACAHVRVVSELATPLGLIVVPGMEVQTREEVHVLCYFPTVEAIEAFDLALSKWKTTIKNNVKAFGHQTLMNHEDKVIGEVEIALILSVDITINDLIDLVNQYKGVVVPAHVNKSANSILMNLGFIPQDLNISTVEIYEKSDLNDRLLKGFRRIMNSDAHYLEMIHEPEYTMTTESKSIQSIIDYLSGKGQL
ncbi:MAG: PHP domain-containing protein [Firmicutes bacterium]|nr:PHP domain-containing protein [Bacillota bacterium]